jgi:hypothetical protein
MKFNTQIEEWIHMRVIILCRILSVCSPIHPVQQKMYLVDVLTVHRSITLIDFQLDAQNSYLFLYHTFIKILHMFRALSCSSSGGLRRKCLYAASGIVTLCR